MDAKRDLIVAIVDLFASLVWPAVFIWFVVVFRRNLEALLGRILSADVVGNKFVFQPPIANAETTPKAELLEAPSDLQGFLTPTGIRDVVSKSGHIPKGETAVDQLLLFDNGAQHTWLVATQSKVAVVLDDANTRRDGLLIQFVMEKKNLLPLDFDTKESGAEAVGFRDKPRPRWYYSKNLYPTRTSLSEHVSRLVQSSD